jgi:hypothetical protein
MESGFQTPTLIQVLKRSNGVMAIEDLSLSRQDVQTLIEIINRYLDDHPDGSNAERGQELRDKLQTAIGRFKLDWGKAE